LTLFHLLSVTAFAIRTCSLLTSRRALGQSIAAHWDLWLMSAPAFVAVICFLIFEDSAGYLAIQHLSDVCTLSVAACTAAFRVELCFRLYPGCYRRAFASSDLSLLPLPLPVLRLACHPSRDGGVVTFPFRYVVHGASHLLHIA